MPGTDVPLPDVPPPPLDLGGREGLEAAALQEELHIAESEIRRLEDVLQKVGPLAGALRSRQIASATIKLGLQGIEEACEGALR